MDQRRRRDRHGGRDRPSPPGCARREPAARSTRGPQGPRVKITDTVAKYYPDLARAADVTLDDLGAHVSGYTDYYPLDFFDRRMQTGIEPDDILQRFDVHLARAEDGCGLTVGPRAGELVLEHGGAVSGFLAENVILPRTRSAIVVLSNSEGGSPSAVADAIAKVLLNEHRPPPPKVLGQPAEAVAREMYAAITFASAPPLQASMYRSLDGRVEQFLLRKP